MLWERKGLGQHIKDPFSGARICSFRVNPGAAEMKFAEIRKCEYRSRGGLSGSVCIKPLPYVLCIPHCDLHGSSFMAQPSTAPCHLLIHLPLRFSHSMSLSVSHNAVTIPHCVGRQGPLMYESVMKRGKSKPHCSEISVCVYALATACIWIQRLTG